MASLTKVSITARKTIRYSIYGVVLLIVARIFFGFAVNIKERFFPSPPPPSTVGFGKLPALEFPDREEVPTFEYRLETPTGALPTFPDKANVYFMIEPVQTQLNYQNALDRANDLGFKGEPIPISQTVYRYPHLDVPSFLEMNIVSHVFSVSYNFVADPELFSIIPPTPEVAISDARRFFRRGDFLKEDLGDSPATHEFLRVEGQKLTPVISLSESDFVKVNIFRKDFLLNEELEIPSLPPDPEQANVWAIISGADNPEKKVVASEYHYFEVDEEKVETYPLKTAEQAYSELENGNAFYANIGDNTSDGEIIVRRVYLAYYDAGIYQEFYQPIVVFEGDGGFFAYVPAVASEYYGATE